MGDRTRVLVVEDEASVQELYKEVLGGGEFDVRIVGTGQAAIDALAAAQFDVVVLDKNLPDISGVEVLRVLRATDRTVGAVMATGYASDHSARDTLNLGIDAYLTKPFDDIADIANRVRDAAEACKGRRSPAPRESSRDVLIACADSGLRQQLRADGVPKSSPVRTADSTEAMLEHARSSPAAVYVLDAGIAKGELVAVVRQLREAAPEAICFVLAGSEQLNVLLSLIDLGVRGVIDKPVNVYDLRGRIELWLLAAATPLH